jgi:hypothetical protein
MEDNTKKRGCFFKFVFSRNYFLLEKEIDDSTPMRKLNKKKYNGLLYIQTC